MSRTPMNENIIRNENQVQTQEAQTAYQDSQKALGEYGANIGTLERGGQVGADPYETPGYLANQNRLTADVTSGENSAAKQELEMSQRRAGGQNTGATNATVANLALGKMRMGNQMQTQQKAQDFSKNLDWQKYLAGSPLATASQEGNLFGTATSGQSATQSSMSQYALAQQQQWYKELQQMIEAGKAAASAGTGAATGGAGVGGFGEG